MKSPIKKYKTMKMKMNLFLMSLLMLVCVNESRAQEAPYKMGIGVSTMSMDAVSFKAFITPKLAIETELGFKWTYPAGFTVNGYSYYGFYRYHYNWLLYTLELNPNLLYQSVIKDWDFGRLDWFVGGGFSLGYAWSWGNTGKFGVNAIGGVELSFKKIPLAVQVDFRPGYGMLFDSYYTAHYFDWGTNISVRYCFGKK